MSPAPTIELVLATYGEPLAWLSSLPLLTDHGSLGTFIYDATCSRPRTIHVPNQAREAGQYLRHIVARYGRFPDWTIFLQGHPFPHCKDLLERLASRDFLALHFTPFSFRENKFARHGPHLHERMTVRFCDHLWGTIPLAMKWHPGAQFAASRQSLMAWPLSFWQRLLALALQHHEISPWALERMWHYLLASPSELILATH